MWVTLVNKVTHQRTAFGEYLIDVPVSGFHRFENRADVCGRNIFVEKIAHSVDKDKLRASPMFRLINGLRAKGEIESTFERVTFHTAKTLSKALCVTMVATSTHLRATGDWIPCTVGPLNGTITSRGDTSARLLPSPLPTK